MKKSKLLVALICLAMPVSGCSWLAKIVYDTATKPKASSTLNMPIGDNKKQVTANLKNKTQTIKGDNKGNQVAHDLIKIDAAVAQLAKTQQINAKEVDSIVNNNRIPGYVWFIFGLLLSFNLFTIYMWGVARNQNRSVQSLKEELEWKKVAAKLYGDQ